MKPMVSTYETNLKPLVSLLKQPLKPMVSTYETNLKPLVSLSKQPLKPFSACLFPTLYFLKYVLFTQVTQMRNLQELKELKGSPLQLPPKGREPARTGLGVKSQ